METLEDFNFTLQYHPRKANVIADALSRKAQFLLSGLVVFGWKMQDCISEFNPCFNVCDSGACFCTWWLSQQYCIRPFKLKGKVQSQRACTRIMVGDAVEGWSIHCNGGIYFFNKLYLPKEAQEKEVMKEAHQSRFTIHLGETKMYHDLRRSFPSA